MLSKEIFLPKNEIFYMSFKLVENTFKPEYFQTSPVGSLSNFKQMSTRVKFPTIFEKTSNQLTSVLGYGLKIEFKKLYCGLWNIL